MAETFFSKIQISEKFHVIHIRNEDDAISHWSKQNAMDTSTFKKVLELKYTTLIEKHIPKDETLLVLTYDLESPVIKYLNMNNYKFYMTKKNLGREQNAILDLLIGSKATGVFIGNFNPIQLRGSSFSYTILQLLDSKTKKVLIDLDAIHNDSV